MGLKNYASVLDIGSIPEPSMCRQVKARLGLIVRWSPAAWLALLVLTPPASAFSLLGPYADWMVYTNGYYNPGEIGGPMDISQGYRWNVPIVTYGFDQSFLDYFGTNGVAAVESAIQVMNDLPPSSQLQVTNYPLSAWRRNFTAENKGLFDLKLAALWGLVEQMGLTSPTRYVFALREWTPAFISEPELFQWWDWAIPDYIILRSFDPFTLRASSYINETLYTAQIPNFPDRHWMQVLPVDSMAESYNAVADAFYNPFDPYGVLATGLTRDDVGGLKFLLSPSNFAYENLLSDVHGVGPNASNYVNGGWRVGVDKVAFVRQSVDSETGQFLSMTNQFTDSYLNNGGMAQQSMERVTTRPDFLFCTYEEGEVGRSFAAALKRTGTTNWVNNAAWNAQPGAPGPGVIRPEVRLSFQKIGPLLVTGESGSGITIWGYTNTWGSFDMTTNSPIAYPSPEVPLNRLNTIVHLGLQDSSGKRLGTYAWSLQLTNGQSMALLTSTNLTDWTTCSVTTNLGTVTEWYHYGTSQARRYFAVRPQ